MPEIETRDRGPRQPAFARFAWGVVVYNVLVILWGAFVRATGSGAGCGNHWPLCDGEVVPQSPGLHKLIEFTHRAMTGLDTPLLILLLVWAFRVFAKGHPVRRAALLSGLFLLSEAGFGALLVKSEHVAQHADPWLSSIHLVNTLTLLACLALTAWWASGKPAVPLRGKALWTAVVSIAALILLSVTGVIAALGDTLFPARSLAAGIAQDFDPGSSMLLRLRALHPLLAAAIATWLTVWAVGRLRSAQSAALRVVIIVWIQLFAGLANFLLQAPVWMQIVHLLVADTLWISVVLLCASKY